MQLCSNCKRIYDDSQHTACPACGRPPAKGPVQLEEVELVSVFRAPDQASADLVRGLLESEGIAAYIDSRQVAWFDGVMTMATGYWGDVVVPTDQEAAARDIIAAYEQSPASEDEIESAETETETQ